MVQNDHQARVGLGADEPAESLLEPDDRLGQLVVGEGVSAGVSDGLDAGLNNRLVRHGKRQLRDNHVRQRLPGDVHTLPEAYRPQQHGPLAGKMLEHCASRQLSALDKHLIILAQAEWFEQFGHHLKHAVAGEKHEAPAVGFFDVVFHCLSSGRHEIIQVVRVAKAGFDVQACLATVIERAGKQQVPSFLHPQAGADIVEAVLPAARRGQRGAGQHRRVHRVEHQLPYNRRYIHRCRRQRDNPPPASTSR